MYCAGRQKKAEEAFFTGMQGKVLDPFRSPRQRPKYYELGLVNRARVVRCERQATRVGSGCDCAVRLLAM